MVLDHVLFDVVSVIIINNSEVVLMLKSGWFEQT